MTLRLKRFFTSIIICLSLLRVASAQDTATLLLLPPLQPFMSSHGFNPMLFQHVATTMNQNALVVDGNAGYVSNTVDVQLLKSVYDNEFITKEQLDRVYDRNENNFVATHLSATVGGTIGNKSSRFKNGLYFQWRDEYTLNLSKGLSGLLYYGNAPFENQTVTTSGTLKSLDYQQLQYVSTYKANPSLQLSGSIGLVKASHSYDADFDGTLFTATDGEYLDLGYNTEIKTYQTKRVLDFAAMGLTFGASMMYHKPGSRNYLVAGLQEVGFISTPSSSKFYRADTAITFDGFQIGNVFGLGDSSFVNLGTDSIKRYLGIHEGNEKFTSGIPARFFAYYQHQFCCLTFGVEMEYAPTVYKTPYLALHAGRWWKRVLYTDLYFHTSTFNTLNAGLSLAMNIYTSKKTRDKYLQIKAQSGYINALVVPENTKGLDALVELSYRF